MKKAIIYSFNTTRTKSIAEQMLPLLGNGDTEILNIEEMDSTDFLRFDLIICGVPTWFDGELPVYWDEWLPAISEMDFSGKKVAIFGLADQIRFPENFADAVGILATAFRNRGAEIIGKTENLGYRYSSSKAIEDGRFLGLILDEDNQPGLTAGRLSDWINQII